MNASCKVLVTAGAVTAPCSLAGAVCAQPAPPAQSVLPNAAAAPLPGYPYDIRELPAFRGTVAHYTLTPPGDVDGLVLGDGTEVHVPPHLSTALVFAVKPGVAVTVRGLRAYSVSMIAAMTVTNDASGQ